METITEQVKQANLERATQDFILGLKQLEQDTGLTLVGTAFNKMHVVPIEDIQPLKHNIKATLTSSPDDVVITPNGLGDGLGLRLITKPIEIDYSEKSI